MAKVQRRSPDGRERARFRGNALIDSQLIEQLHRAARASDSRRVKMTIKFHDNETRETQDE